MKKSLNDLQAFEFMPTVDDFQLFADLGKNMELGLEKVFLIANPPINLLLSLESLKNWKYRFCIKSNST